MQHLQYQWRMMMVAPQRITKCHIDNFNKDPEFGQFIKRYQLGDPQEQSHRTDINGKYQYEKDHSHLRGQAIDPEAGQAQRARPHIDPRLEFQVQLPAEIKKRYNGNKKKKNITSEYVYPFDLFYPFFFLLCQFGFDQHFINAYGHCCNKAQKAFNHFSHVSDFKY